MGTKDKERRVYSREFKAEAVAPAGKKEKPISRIAVDLGINENMLRHRYSRPGRRQRGDYRPSPGTDGRAMRNLPACGKKTRRYAEFTPPPFTRNPKKSGRTLVRVIFAQTEGR
jgi:transposase-like protein